MVFVAIMFKQKKKNNTSFSIVDDYIYVCNTALIRTLEAFLLREKTTKKQGVRKGKIFVHFDVDINAL